MTTGPAETTAAGPARHRYVVLAALLAVYTFNFIDRQILGILAGPIKAELNLSDGQLGLLGGIAFALLYSTLAVPLAALADRTGRSRVIAISLAVWSGFTALCGLATSFVQLFLCRLGVGIGEAGGVAPSYAVIAGAFPPREQARALSVYSLGIPLGSAAGVLFGGYLAARVDWRAAFLAVGIAGALLAPLFGLLVRDRPVAPTVAKPRFAEVARLLAGKRSFWLLSFGAASSSMLGYGLAFWLPSLMQRSFGLDLIDTSRFYGAILLLGGIAGVLGGGWLGDRLGQGDRGAYAKLPAIAFLGAAPLFAAGALSHSAQAAFLLFLIPQGLAYVWLGPVISAVQHLVPPPMRATASACFLLINNLIGLGGGTFFLGKLSDWLAPQFGDESLRVAFVASLGLYGLAALLMALAVKPLRRDWIG